MKIEYQQTNKPTNQQTNKPTNQQTNKLNNMDMEELTTEIDRIEYDQFGLNKILINLILQIFIKNNVDDPNDIINTIADYMSVSVESSIISTIAGQLNIIKLDDSWIWCV